MVMSVTSIKTGSIRKKTKICESHKCIIVVFVASTKVCIVQKKT